MVRRASHIQVKKKSKKAVIWRKLSLRHAVIWRYVPNAVIGLACRYFLGRVLQPEEFSGGEAPGQANYVLRKLGFTVIRKGEEVADDEKPAYMDWTQDEVSLIIAD